MSEFQVSLLETNEKTVLYKSLPYGASSKRLQASWISSSWRQNKYYSNMVYINIY